MKKLTTKTIEDYLRLEKGFDVIKATIQSNEINSDQFNLIHDLLDKLIEKDMYEKVIALYGNLNI